MNTFKDSKGAVHHVIASWMEVDQIDLWPGDTVDVRGEVWRLDADNRLRRVDVNQVASVA